MKTTLEIPDPIFRRAKIRASELGIPLREFVTVAVDEKLRGATGKDNKPWMKYAGSLRHLHRENLRIGKIIEDTFGKIEPEDWV